MISIADIITFLSNTIVSAALIGYIFLFWFALTFWCAMDIFARTKNWFARFGAVLLVGLVPVLGFVLYLIIRPQSTLDDLKVRTLEEKVLESQSRAFVCPHCLEIVREDFIFCPSCGFNIKKECPACKRILEIAWAQCPYCGVGVGVPVLPTIGETPKLIEKKSNGSLFKVFTRMFSSPSTAQPAEIKRKRGRPRKPAPLGPVIKRGRGRPRKDEAVPTTVS